MDVNASNKTRQAIAQARPLLLVLAAVLALLALWLAWTGWQQMQDGTRRDALSANRDALAQSASRSLGNELERLQERMASAPVREALAAGDFAAAAEELGRDWPGLEHAR